MTSTTSWENCGRAAERLPYLLERRRALGVLGLGGAMVIAGRGQAAANDQVPKSLRYLAYVDGSRSGIQDIEFVPRERGFTVMSSLCFRLEVAFVTIYRYQQTGQEDWKDGKLVEFEYITNNDGATSHVTARRDGSDNFSVIGQNGQRTAPGDAMAASFWNGAILDRPHIIDPRTGELATLSVRSLEQKSAKIARRTIHGNGYTFQTFIAGDLWFDEQRRSLALTFEKEGHKVELVRET